MILKVTQKHSIYFKDLCYKLLRLSKHKYKHLENSSYYRVNVKIITLFYCYFKKIGYQTYFNQVLLRCRHSGVNSPDQTREDRKKKVKGGHSLQKSWNL
jgi:hypothetical protein